jgi:hypothetical protein
LLVNTVPIETFVSVCTDAAATAKLKAAGVTVAAKTLKLDLSELLRTLNPNGDFFGHDKIEGVTTPDGGKTLMLANDSDYGLAGLASNTPPFRFKPKVLANGLQDSGEVLVVDTSQLAPGVAPKMDVVTVPITVG